MINDETTGVQQQANLSREGQTLEPTLNKKNITKQKPDHTLTKTNIYVTKRPVV